MDTIDIDTARHGAPVKGDVPVGLQHFPGLLGIHPQTVHTWRARKDLLAAEDVIGKSPWWWRSQVLAWHHLRHHPDASVAELAEVAGVPQTTVRDWLDAGRLDAEGDR